ncbi:MAG: hypothetical protein ACREHG_11495, partial [Candidatus Saccharimonadales bacterium]
AQLSAADPAVGELIEEGFVLLAVNDGRLAAQAAASRVGEHRYGKTGALIFGTGVGAGVVEKDPEYGNVHRTDSRPYEIGHLLMGVKLYTFEDCFSGPGIEEYTGNQGSPESIDRGNPVWKGQGRAVGTLATALGLMGGVELVVPTGGVGAGASDKYESHLTNFLSRYRESANPTQLKFLPEVKLVPREEAAEFELYGAEGVMRDYLTSAANVE